MKNLLTLLKPYLAKDLKIRMSSDKKNIYIFNWEAWNKQHNKLMEKIEQMNEDEIDDFLSYNESKVMQIQEYYMDDECIKKVHDKKWFPFGILGLVYEPESFTELMNDGIVLFDLTAGEKNDPQIILFKDKKTQVLAKKFSEFSKLLHK